jgi:hypothetical protein
MDSSARTDAIRSSTVFARAVANDFLFQLNGGLAARPHHP